MSVVEQEFNWTDISYSFGCSTHYVILQISFFHCKSRNLTPSLYQWWILGPHPDNFVYIAGAGTCVVPAKIWESVGQVKSFELNN